MIANIIGEENYKLIFLEETLENKSSIKLLSSVMLSNIGIFYNTQNNKGNIKDICNKNKKLVKNAYINNNYFANKNFMEYPNITHLTLNLMNFNINPMKNLSKLKYLRIYIWFGYDNLNILKYLPDIYVLILECNPIMIILDYLTNLPVSLKKIIFLIRNNKDDEFIKFIKENIKLPFDCKLYFFIVEKNHIYDEPKHMISYE
jgi:hypothetical protein